MHGLEGRISMSSKKKRIRSKARAEPAKKRTQAWFCSQDAFDVLTCHGYTSLAHNPEIITAVNTIAKLIGSMTIHLMENTADGDIRIKNELSRKLDIYPNENMTRSSFIQWLVRTMLLEGNGNAIVLPKLHKGLLEDLRPVPASMVAFIPVNTWKYKVSINGAVYDSDEFLHFVLNPNTYYPWKGEGVSVVLKDVANNLKQAAATEKGFMQSKWKPSIIVKVDALTEEFSSPEGRQELLNSYIDTTQAGEPWMIPAEQFEIEQVKPLSLADLALADMVQLDKKTVASILGVPSFVLGVGEFHRDAWNNFINATIMPIAQMIEQELSRKLLIKPEWYFRFNPRSLYNYELRDMAAIADDQFVRGIMSGNEVRDWLGLSPREGLNELVILENYIPRGMIGEQSKLIQSNAGGD